MSLQTVMQNRRKFLEHSLLGAGGVLFLPVLVGSCTDHRIPDPGTPIMPITDMTFDWNDDAKIVVKTGLEMIPEAGEILGGLVDIFWPNTKVDVWGEVKTQLETYVNQKISDLVYLQVSEDLAGLKNSTLLYLQEVKTGNSNDIKTQWLITRNSFAEALPHFQSAGNELPLLGLFGQFANMYLAILRDGVAFGKSWGRTDTDQKQDITDLKTAITDYTNYTTTWYNNGRTNVQKATKADNHLCQPFRSVNEYDRPMVLKVLDFMDTWPYYDVTLYPAGTTVVSTRETYSDPYGTGDDSGNIVIASPPTQFPTQLSVWGWDRIDAVQLTYPAGSGPGGVTQTARMGDSGGGSNQPPHGGVFKLSENNPIIQAKVTFSDCVNAFHFVFNDKTITNKLGGNYPEGTDSVWEGLTTGCLSSIHINGVSRFKQSADCVVFGFKFWVSPSATLRAISAIYVKSPKERSAAEFAKAFPNLAVSANLITEELKAARRVYWAYVKTHVK
jgi:hypothetical protein